MRVLTLIAMIALAGCGGGKGDQGDTGPVGPQGAVGKDGTSGLVVKKNVFCTKIDGGSGGTFFYQYRIVLYSNNDVFTTCSITATNAGYSNTNYWSASQTGSSTAGCQVGADIDTPSAGFWSFQLSGSNLQVEYRDTGSTHNNYVYTFVPADCTII